MQWRAEGGNKMQVSYAHHLECAQRLAVKPF